MTTEELAPAWQPGRGCRYYRKGDTVRVEGITGARFTVVGFDFSRSPGVLATLYGAKRGRAPLTRVVAATRLIRVRARE